MSSGVYSKLPVAEAADLLEFWFGDPSDQANLEGRNKLWFSSTRAQDRELRERFGALHVRAAAGELGAWMDGPRTALALIVLLDQLTRNLYRGAAAAFANDARALMCSRQCIERGFDSALYLAERTFLYMPFQHSEDPAVQRRSVELFEALAQTGSAPFDSFAENVHKHAVLHCEIVERFGRFPHRNALLGRPSTKSEKEYLEQGGRRFGQG